VLGYFVAIHILEGYIVAPRVLAKAVGLHPAISIIALLVGAQILGIWGALFAAPLVGFVQVLFTAAWVEWRHDHLSQFADKVVKADKMGVAPAPRTPAMPDRTADILAPTTDKSLG
jgi:predicted PurR-regulated permease PerM